MNKKFERQFVGVVPISIFDNLSYPKQFLLMFDCLAIDLGIKGLDKVERSTLKSRMPEIQKLIDNEMLTLLSGLMASNEIEPSKSAVLNAQHALATGVITPERFNAQKLRDKGIDAVAITQPYNDAGIDGEVTRDSAIRITLSEFPMPAVDTPWEAIRDFRLDKDAVHNFSKLKVWMNNAGKLGLKEYEIKDELRFLISEYSNSMSIHKLKKSSGTFETVVTATASAIDGFARLNFTDAMKSIFQIHKQDVKLLEDEINLPGKEIAYIIGARNRFA
ncbi:MAG TPA: hypothetical protein ENH82_04105 [bacterium]|nr:hypothetical protein [bacterium]